MIRYARYSRPELRQFLRDLHLGAQSTGKNLNKALKPDLLRALREADASRTFRFLDLPPELRTTIYRELLVIEGSSTSCSSPKCHPQILRTSKKVNQEASGILYGDNVIECGTYQPAVKPHVGSEHPRRQIRHLVWPKFLRRARVVRVVVVDTQTEIQQQTKPPNLGTGHNMLFSLCAFVQKSVALKSLTLDLTWLTTRYFNLGRLNTFEAYLHTTVYPLHMLHSRVQTRVTGVELLSLPQALQPNPTAIELAKTIAEGSLSTTMHHLRATLRADSLLDFPMEIRTVDVASIICAGLHFALALGASARLNMTVGWWLGHLRDSGDNAEMDQVPDMVRKQLEGLLRLAVELKRTEREI